MLCNNLHSLAASRSLQHCGIALEFLKNAPQRLSNQHVIIDYQYFHVTDPRLYQRRTILYSQDLSIPLLVAAPDRQSLVKQALLRRATIFCDRIADTLG
jgi:hypothetical protein